MMGSLLGGALTLPGCVQRIGGRPLRAADTHPFDYPTVTAVAYMGKLLDERSGGRLRIRSYPGGQLGEEKDTLEITIFGGLDINRVNLAPLNPIASETIVPNLPFVFRSTEHMHRAMDGAPGQRILASLEPHGLIGLCFYDSGARSFYDTRRPIRTPADLRGLKIRVQNSDVFVAMVEALGADATPMSYGEVYQSLIQGVVDGAENNWPAYENSRHYEAAKFYSLTQHVMAPEVLVVSARTWSKLSRADRDLMRAAAHESVPVMRDLWERREAEARALLVREGVVVNEIADRSAFERAVQPVWKQFVRTPEQRAIISQIRALA